MNRQSYRRYALYFPLISLYLAHSSLANAAQCDYVINNEWNSGFTANVKITNDTQQAISGWSTEILYADSTTITNMWNADVSGSNPFVATNKNYNRNIAPGSSVQFGFNGRKGTANSPAVMPSLAGICGNESGNAAPVANAQASVLNGQAPLTVQFDATSSSDADGDELSYLWQLTDNDTSTSAKPSFTFDEVGDYTVSLTVNDGSVDSQADSLTVSVTAVSPSTARCEFVVAQEWQSGYTGNVAIYNDADVAIDGWQVVLNYTDNTTISGAWNSTVSGSNPFTFSNANYNKTIRPGANVSFGFNAQKGQSGQPVVAPSLSGICDGVSTPNQPPVASIDASSLAGTVPFDVSFSGAGSSDPEGADLTYSWTIESAGQDTVTSSEPQISQTFTQSGEYVVSLTVSDGELNSDTVSVTVQVREPLPGEVYLLSPERSSLHFVSTKKIHVIETHTFTELAGTISEEGEATLSIALDSIESGIDIRNTRMREHLFETNTFSHATVSLQVDMDALTAMTDGEVSVQSIDADLDLHGVVATVSTQVRVSKLNASTVLVQNVSPIAINAEDFALTSGIETLRNLAGLDVISYAFPVNFTLVFTAQQGGAQ